MPSAITSDGMLGTVVTPDGRVFNITGGSRPGQGPNLFHSFGRFDVGTGDTAHFVGQPGINNIIGRVTGGSASLIDGRLQSDASLFLLNPSGLMFGPNATLDVNGSFYTSTADVLRFADGAAFSAHLNEKSILTVAAPSAFGFLSERPASMTIERSHLEVHEGETLSIVGGNIDVVGGTLKAPGGRITIIGVASSGDAMVNNSELLAEINLEDFDRLGVIRITQEGLIDTQGLDGGSVVLRGGHLMIDNASIQAGTIRDMGDHEAGIDIEMAEDILLTNGGVIRTVAQGDQDAADIRVTTRDLHMEGASFIVSGTSSAGRAGDVSVNAANVTALEGSQINSLTFGPGPGGTVSIRATDTVTLSGISEDGELLQWHIC